MKWTYHYVIDFKLFYNVRNINITFEIPGVLNVKFNELIEAKDTICRFVFFFTGDTLTSDNMPCEATPGLIF
jgi:hypothetical protein